MNRRGFLKGLLGAAVAAVARVSPLVALSQGPIAAAPMTLLDAARSLPDDFGVGAVAEILAAQNELFCDALFYGSSPGMDALKDVGVLPATFDEEESEKCSCGDSFCTG